VRVGASMRDWYFYLTYNYYIYYRNRQRSSAYIALMSDTNCLWQQITDDSENDSCLSTKYSGWRYSTL